MLSLTSFTKKLQVFFYTDVTYGARLVYLDVPLSPLLPIYNVT